MDQESGDKMEGNQKQSSGETVIVIELDVNDESSVTGDDAKAKKEDGFSCCVDVNYDDSQRVCRICHLNAKEEQGKTNPSKDLMELGCSCKGELGFSHLRCAEAWFKLKGNRFCEICGETAENVRGVGNRSFMEEWSAGRSDDDGGSSGESRGCRERQPLCNILMGCLVIAFVLPWFLRVNL